LDNLSEYTSKLKIKIVNERRFVWDILRKKWILLQPEEFVRQIMVHYLIENSYPIGKITIERSVKSFSKQGRYDLLIFDKFLKPFLLVECKAFDVQIKSHIDIQVGSYNTVLVCPFICITNGVTMSYFKNNPILRNYEKIDQLPVYPH
jgi:hypothetical protein